jgi:hypothetical protein
MSDHDLFPEEPDEEQPAAELPESVPDDVPEAVPLAAMMRRVRMRSATGPKPTRWTRSASKRMKTTTGADRSAGYLPVREKCM